MSGGAPKSERSRSQGQALLFRGNRQGPGRSEGWRGSRNLEGEKVRSGGTQFRRARLGVSLGRQAKRCPEDGRGRKEVNQTAGANRTASSQKGAQPRAPARWQSHEVRRSHAFTPPAAGRYRHEGLPACLFSSMGIPKSLGISS